MKYYNGIPVFVSEGTVKFVQKRKHKKKRINKKWRKKYGLKEVPAIIFANSIGIFMHPKIYEKVKKAEVNRSFCMDHIIQSRKMKGNINVL